MASIVDLIAAIIFGIALIVFAVQGKWAAVYVCGIAGGAYALMWWKSQSHSQTETKHASVFDSPVRYLDWALTTPIIVYAIMSGLDHGPSEIEKMAIVAADIGMIVCGWLGSRYPKHLVFWFACGCVLFIPVFYTLLQISRRGGKHVAVAILTLSIWLLYPVVYILDARNMMDVGSIVVIIDIVAKVGFGILD